MNKKREWISLIIGYIGSVLGLYAVILFNDHVMASLPIWLRTISSIFVYWLAALVPVIIMLINKDKLSDYGFRKNRVLPQIFKGLALAVCLTIMFTLIPRLFGLGDYVSNDSGFSTIWQFVYYLIYCIFSVSLVEEFVFRGFIYNKIKNIFGKDIIAIIGSSILFGLFHAFNGNILQIVLTTIIGIVLATFRLKVKETTTLSLIIGHGVYDFLIIVFTAIFK